MLRYAVFLLFLPCAGLAQGIKNGNHIYSECRSDVQAEEALCIGYIAGVAEVFLAFARDLPESQRPFCTAPGQTVGQLTDVVLKWLDEHPEKRHLNGSDVIALAMAGAFPCN